MTPVEQYDRYTCRLGTLRRGDRFTTRQGPYFLRADGSRTSAAEKGPFTFRRHRWQPRAFGAAPAARPPWVTLYSAILWKIAAKGKDARFVKTDRGHFKSKG